MRNEIFLKAIALNRTDNSVIPGLDQKRLGAGVDIETNCAANSGFCTDYCLLRRDIAGSAGRFFAG